MGELYKSEPHQSTKKKPKNPWMEKVDEATREHFSRGGPHTMYIGLSVKGGTSDETDERIEQMLKNLKKCQDQLETCLSQLGVKPLSIPQQKPEQPDFYVAVMITKRLAKQLVEKEYVRQISDDRSQLGWYRQGKTVTQFGLHRK